MDLKIYTYDTIPSNVLYMLYNAGMYVSAKHLLHPGHSCLHFA